MRLKEIKLAGFKSFVDPTHISIPGHVVGIVGPNGCGKSNVIDAVRWVLGESSARHLRGETMQDVIFNGAGDRKQGHRASVELVFDNSLSRAGGEWASYAEIAIRRVLEREGNSEYYINGVHVRRRDVADLFLGTGVGARAYGIIEQGMISQIIEAKPEELRVFLEEAAGVSKYRERRRETELRLSDTRDNLQRVTDIREELGKQLERLQAQAEVAVKYRDLQHELDETHQLLWLVRKQEAAAQRARIGRDLERASLDAEAEVARLREVERRLEELRAQFYATSDVVSAAQGRFFQAGAEVARIEQQLQFMRDSRSRVEQQLQQVEGDLAQCTLQRTQSAASHEEWQHKLATATGQLERLLVRVASESERLPVAEASFRDAQNRVDELRAELARIDQDLQVQGTHVEHADKLLLQLEGRGQRLTQERATLAAPDDEGLQSQRRELSRTEAELDELRAALERHASELPERERAWREGQQAVEAIAARVTSLGARRAALEALQARLARGDNIKDWLERHGLAARKRLWQEMRIEGGWEDALEAVLEERLNAVAVERMHVSQQWWTQFPPAKLAMFSADATDGVAAAESWRGLEPLAAYVASREEPVARVLSEWLHGVYVVESVAIALDMRLELAVGMMLVTREGHMFTRQSARFYAPDSELHGVLSRQREIEQIGAQIDAEQVVLDDRRRSAQEREDELTRLRNRIASLRTEIDAGQERAHALELDVLRLSEQVDRSTQRGAQIAAELAEIGQQSAAESDHRRLAQAEVERLQALRAQADAALGEANARYNASQSALQEQRRALQEAEKESQEAVFQQKACAQRIVDLEQLLAGLEEQRARLAESESVLRAEAVRFDEAPLAEELQRALEARGTCERALAQARDEQQVSETILRQTEQERLGAEQRLEPLRARIGELRLKEQEARLTEEQFDRQLVDAGADQDALRAQLEKGTRSSRLNAEITRLQEEIAALGAVNLAALEELSAARERKEYLDAQSADLTTALETLENAIRRIDRETRELLAATFEAVNRNFGELFPSLFGGGQARLVLTGEEILDAGIQVTAQPPGKRNTSIHLLSGGEKALTALALIFSMFKLNPAPFCLLDEVDAPLDDSNTLRFCALVKRMAADTQFIFISHNKLTMEIAEQLVGVTMQELGVSRVVAVDIEEALKLTEKQAA